MRKIKRLKNKLVGNDEVFTLDNFVEEKKIDRNVVGSISYAARSRKTARETSCISSLKPTMNYFMKLAKALFLVAPTKIFGEATGTPFFGFGHL